MCGIFGVINGTKNRSASFGICNFVKDSFVAGTLRGDDSSGLFQIDKKMDTFLYKEPTDGKTFIDLPKTAKYIRDVDTSIVTVGHNRAATAGIVSQENAHPFTHTNESRTVVGVHNGTLQDWNRIKDSANFKVDSDWAMHKLATEGSVNAFEYFRGAFCFVWHDDSVEGVLNIARNSQRPMFFAYVKDKDQMIFASEAGMLAWLATRNHLNIEGIIYEIEAGKHYQFNLDNPRVFTRTDLIKDDYKHFFPQFVQNHGGGKKHKKNRYANESAYDESDWSAWGSGWSSANSSQAKFFERMDELLVLSPEVQASFKKETEVLSLADLENKQELAIIEQGDFLGKLIEGVYESEIAEAEELQLKDMSITCEYYDYDADKRVAYFKFLFTDNPDDDCPLFKDIGFIEVRNVPKSSSKSLEKAGTQKLLIKGVYYSTYILDETILIADNGTIERCRRAAAAADALAS